MSKQTDIISRYVFRQNRLRRVHNDFLPIHRKISDSGSSAKKEARKILQDKKTRKEKKPRERYTLLGIHRVVTKIEFAGITGGFYFRGNPPAVRILISIRARARTDARTYVETLQKGRAHSTDEEGALRIRVGRRPNGRPTRISLSLSRSDRD